jgi:hypothetical protein
MRREWQGASLIPDTTAFGRATLKGSAVPASISRDPTGAGVGIAVAIGIGI